MGLQSAPGAVLRRRKKELPARVCLSYVVGVCAELTDPVHGGGPGGFIDETTDLQYG